MDVPNRLLWGRVSQLQHTPAWTTGEPRPTRKHLAEGMGIPAVQDLHVRGPLWWVCLQNPGERMSLVTFQAESISHWAESELSLPLICSLLSGPSSLVGYKIAVWESVRRWVGERVEANHSPFLKVRQLPRKDEGMSYLCMMMTEALINIMDWIYSSYWIERVLGVKMTIGPSIICQFFSSGSRGWI